MSSATKVKTGHIPTIRNYQNGNFTLPPIYFDRLRELNKLVEQKSGINVGDSFIVRKAIEMLLKREDVVDFILNERVKFLSQKANL